MGLTKLQTSDTHTYSCGQTDVILFKNLPNFVFLQFWFSSGRVLQMMSGPAGVRLLPVADKTGQTCDVCFSA